MHKPGRKRRNAQTARNLPIRVTAHERLLKKLTTNARRVNCAVEVVVYKANGMPEDPSYVLIEGDRDALRFALVCCKHRQKRMIADSRSAPKKLESSVQK
jgi:hypothetical protein